MKHKIILGVFLFIFLFLLGSCSPALLNLADQKLQQEKYSEAVSLYDQYLSENIAAFIPSRKFAYALFMSGDIKAATHRFENILQEHPDDSYTKIYLGLAYLHNGSRDKVLSVWQDFQSISFSNVTEEINRQSKLIAASGPLLSSTIITSAENAITDAVDADRARNAYNLWRLGDCG